MKLEQMPNGRGALVRSGRPKGAKGIVSRTFQQFAEATLNDPEIRAALRQRVLDEIAGKRRNPMPCVAVLAAAAVKERAVQGTHTNVTFIATITNGRGDVRRVELVNDEDDALDAVVVPALPAGENGDRDNA
jgi:hypothetical protein